MSQSILDELNKAKEDLVQSEKLQQVMKDANAVIRSGKDVETKLADIGLNPGQIHKLLSPDYMGRKGFPDYKLKNNNANIRRLKERVTMLESKWKNARTDNDEEIPFPGGKVIVNYEIDRVQIKHNTKPPKEIIEKIKSQGFKYSFNNYAWQRKITPQAISVAKSLIPQIQIEGEPVEEVTITANTPPEPQPEPIIETLKEGIPEIAEKIHSYVAPYGWSAYQTGPNNISLKNRKGVIPAMVWINEEDNDKYSIVDTVGKILLSGKGKLQSSVEKVLTQYYYAKKEEAPPAPVAEAEKEKTQAEKIEAELRAWIDSEGLPKPETTITNDAHTAHLRIEGAEIEITIDDNKSPIAPGILVKRNNSASNFKLAQIQEAKLSVKKLYEQNKPIAASGGQALPAPPAASLAAFKGFSHTYKNQYELNKAIEEYITEKGPDPNSYNSDEKTFIRKYSGYGGLDKYGPTGKGGLFEYYTPQVVIEKMWALAYKYGYKEGSVLEPSVATGEFLQYAPKGSRIVGYEINEFSKNICKILYPAADIRLQPFEQVFISKNWTVKDKTDHLEKFDLVIGNPPYGDFSIVESRYMSGMGEKDFTGARNYVEYFIRRSVDLLKPKGLLVFIVGAQVKNGGTLFLDSGETLVKEWLYENTIFLDAYRLPDSIFERTGVTSEIIVLQKN